MVRKIRHFTSRQKTLAACRVSNLIDQPRSYIIGQEGIQRYFVAVRGLRRKTPLTKFAEWRIEQEARLPGVYATHPVW